MKCRKAEESDVALLARINQQLIEDEWGGGGMPLDRLEARIRRWLEEGEYQAVLFEEKGDVIAYALVHTDEESAYIRHFFVLPEHRRGGVGRRVVDTLMKDVIPPTARVTLDVLASNRTGHRFWHSVGFTDYAIRMERLPSIPPATPDATPDA